MSSRSMCGIRAHVVDPPLCVFHAPSNAKTSQEFLAALRAVYSLKVGTIFDQSAAFRGKATVKEYDFTAFVCPVFELPGAVVDLQLVLNRAVFLVPVNFAGRVFASTFAAIDARFTADAMFDGALFQGGAHFNNAKFEGVTSFRNSSFDQPSSFANATFNRGADFTLARFASNEDAAPAILDMRRARCTDDTMLLLHDINRGAERGLRLRIRGVAVDQLQLKRVNWYHEDGRAVLQDEVDARRRPYETDMVAAIDSYRALLAYFDREGESDLAEDCYWGGMELRRLKPARSGDKDIDEAPAMIPSLSYRIGTWLSLISIYRVASSYGSSYRRALSIMMMLLLSFAILYALPTTELYRIEGRQPATGLVDPLYHSVEVAAFTRSPLFATEGRFGRLLELAEGVLLPSQVALFLLALRRRFAR